MVGMVPRELVDRLDRIIDRMFAPPVPPAPDHPSVTPRAPHETVDRLLARPSSPPGGGCDIPREIHSHWCGFCWTGQLFTREQCRTLAEPPRCVVCRSVDWRTEDEIIRSRTGAS